MKVSYGFEMDSYCILNTGLSAFLFIRYFIFIFESLLQLFILYLMEEVELRSIDVRELVESHTTSTEHGTPSELVNHFEWLK